MCTDYLNRIFNLGRFKATLKCFYCIQQNGRLRPWPWYLYGSTGALLLVVGSQYDHGN